MNEYPAFGHSNSNLIISNYLVAKNSNYSGEMYFIKPSIIHISTVIYPYYINLVDAI